MAAGIALALLLLLAPVAARAASERTGRLLVTLEPKADVPQLGAIRRDGAQVPQIDLMSIRPTGGRALGAVAALLRRRDAVARVEVERRYELRLQPNDPALTTPETFPGTPGGTTRQWWVPRLGLPAAWDIERGAGATVAVIDTGVDSGHPDLGGKIERAIDNDFTPGHGPAGSDENGHGSHVSSLACAAGDNGAGIVGAGFDCRLVVIKTDLSTGSIARSIVQAADLGVGAISMSFGTDGSRPASLAIRQAIDYAVSKDVVLVAAAGDRPSEQQGDPANLLQPTGTGSDITAGRGLSVTSADFFDNRSPFAGRGSQISLAAYGSFDRRLGPAGLLGAFPGNVTETEAGSGGLLPEPGCDCRTQVGGDRRYAYLQGTSMAAPIVAAIAALGRNLNPDVSADEVIRILKQTARRPAGSGWEPELGWGIVNASAAMKVIAELDRSAPASKLRGPRIVKRARSVKLRWSGTDRAPPKLKASGVDHYEVYRSANRGDYRRIKRTRRKSLRVRVRPGSLYRFYTIAVDEAGNREAIPSQRDLTMRIRKHGRR